MLSHGKTMSCDSFAVFISETQSEGVMMFMYIQHVGFAPLVYEKKLGDCSAQVSASIPFTRDGWYYGMALFTVTQICWTQQLNAQLHDMQ